MTSSQMEPRTFSHFMSQYFDFWFAIGIIVVKTQYSDGNSYILSGNNSSSSSCLYSSLMVEAVHLFSTILTVNNWLPATWIFAPNPRYIRKLILQGLHDALKSFQETDKIVKSVKMSIAGYLLLKLISYLQGRRR